MVGDSNISYFQMTLKIRKSTSFEYDFIFSQKWLFSPEQCPIEEKPSNHQRFVKSSRRVLTNPTIFLYHHCQCQWYTFVSYHSVWWAELWDRHASIRSNGMQIAFCVLNEFIIIMSIIFKEASHFCDYRNLNLVQTIHTRIVSLWNWTDFTYTSTIQIFDS